MNDWSVEKKGAFEEWCQGFSNNHQNWHDAAPDDAWDQGWDDAVAAVERRLLEVMEKVR